MKRILMLAVIAIFVGMPIASFAKIAISDSDLDALTAQAGINICFTNFAISSAVTAGKMSFGDSDGLGSVEPLGPYYTNSYGSAGYMGMNNIVITGNLVFMNGTMNVDVGTSGGKTELNIVLPSSVIIGGSSGMNITANVVLDSAKALNSGVSGSLATLGIQGFSTFVTGTVTVFAH